MKKNSVFNFARQSIFTLVILLPSLTTIASQCRQLHFTSTAEMLPDGTIDAEQHLIPADATLCDTGTKSASIVFHFADGTNTDGKMIKMKKNLYLIINSKSEDRDVKKITYFQFSDNGVFHYTTSLLGSGYMDKVDLGIGKWK